MNKTFSFILQDVEPGIHPKDIKATVTIENMLSWIPGGTYLSIQFEGYGDNSTVDGKGIPVLIENRAGIPYVVIWNDINREDASHSISLENAKESERNSR